MKEGKFPHTRKPLHWRGQGVAGVGELQSHGGEHSNRGAEGKVERFPHRGSLPPAVTSLRGLSAYLPAGTGRGWELRLGLQRSDPRERTGVGCMNTA